MTKWSTGFCETSRINIHYTRTGEDKHPLILLHGLAANGACWTPIAQALEGRYDVIMPDARGHGKSSVPNDGYRYEDLANDVEDLIEALELSSPILVGHSMGGMTAALVASRKNSLLGGVILVDPTFLSLEVQHEIYKGDTVEQQRQFLNKSLDEVLAEAQIKQPHRSFNTIKLINKARHQTSTIPFQVLTPPNPEYEQLVSEIDVQCLLVISDKGIVSTAMAKGLQSLNPKIQVAMITDAGHGLHYDQPEQFIAVVKSFLHSN